MSEGKVPKSPETLKIDQLVNEFKDQADSLFVKPFSDEKWSSA
jgi:poly-D-alanine transfer protein DltD